MSRRLGRYDSELQMFQEEPHPLNLNRLGFLRWLGEHGKLEHETAGPPSGPLVASAEGDPGSQPPAYTGRAA